MLVLWQCLEEQALIRFHFFGYANPGMAQLSSLFLYSCYLLHPSNLKDLHTPWNWNFLVSDRSFFLMHFRKHFHHTFDMFFNVLEKYLLSCNSYLVLHFGRTSHLLIFRWNLIAPHFTWIHCPLGACGKIPWWELLLGRLWVFMSVKAECFAAFEHRVLLKPNSLRNIIALYYLMTFDFSY